MQAIELVFARGGVERSRALLARLPTMAPMVALILDPARDRALLLCEDGRLSSLLGAINALALAVLALHVGELRESDTQPGGLLPVERALAGLPR